jgi:hypothetical protein
MGLSILELIPHCFPFPGKLLLVALIMHISASKVSLVFGTGSSTHPRGRSDDDDDVMLQPPRLEDELDLNVPWSDAMKDFITLAVLY